MDSIPPKDKVAKLSPEQQDAVARMALGEAQFRESQLSKVRSYRGTYMIPVAAWIGGACLIMWVGHTNLIAPLLFLITLLYIEFHARGTNARLDALIRLLDLEKTAGKPGRETQINEPQQNP